MEKHQKWNVLIFLANIVECCSSHFQKELRFKSVSFKKHFVDFILILLQ